LGGDLNGDGLADVLIGLPGSSQIYAVVTQEGFVPPLSSMSLATLPGQLGAQLVGQSGDGAGTTVGTRVYAIEDGRRRPVRQKELALVLLGAIEPRPEDLCAPPSAESSEILEAIRFTLSVVKRALLERLTNGGGPGSPFIKSDGDRAAHNQERDAVRDDEW
jgi:hypothetical protein